MVAATELRIILRWVLKIASHQNFHGFFIDHENLCSTIGIMQADLKQDMKNHENPTGAKRIGYLPRYIFLK